VRHMPPVVFAAANQGRPSELPRQQSSPSLEAGEARSEGGTDERATVPRAVALEGIGDDVAADLYGLAALTYECLSGLHPYFREDRDVGDGLLAILREAPASLAEEHGVHPRVAAAVEAALGRDPAGRYANVEALVAAVRAATPEDERALADKAARRQWGDLSALPHDLGAAAGRTRSVSQTVIRALAVLVALLVVADAALFFYATSEPVTSFAKVPEFVPPAPEGEGVDVVITAVEPNLPGDPHAPTHPVDAELHVVSTHGETAYLASTPFVLRGQRAGARLRLVLTSEGMRVHNFDIVVRDDGEQTMFVSEPMESIVPRHGLQQSAQLALE